MNSGLSVVAAIADHVKSLHPPECRALARYGIHGHREDFIFREDFEGYSGLAP
jgi:hypothetical protein